MVYIQEVVKKRKLYNIYRGDYVYLGDCKKEKAVFYISWRLYRRETIMAYIQEVVKKRKLYDMSEEWKTLIAADTRNKKMWDQVLEKEMFSRTDLLNQVFY